jgi:hypothetical protein
LGRPMAVRDDFVAAVSSLGDVGGLWDCFAIVHSRGFDGKPIFAAILPKLVTLGCGLLVLLSLFRVMEMLTRQVEGEEDQSPLGLATEATLLAVLIVAYDPLLLLIPQLFDTLGHSLSGLFAADLAAQLAGSLETLGNEKLTDFRFWSGSAFMMSIVGVLSSMLSFAALVLVWVMGKLQAYLFTFWYLLGPVALPTLLFPPLRRIGLAWLSSFLGTAFMSISGSLFYFIMVRSSWLPKAFSAGSASDYIGCLVYSLLCILLLVTIPFFSLRLWSGIEMGGSAAFVSARSLMNKGTGMTTSAWQKTRAVAGALRGAGAPKSISTPKAP